MNPFRIINVNRFDSDTAAMPLTLAQAKSWLKITFSDDDIVISDLIEECTRAVEEYCTLSIVDSQLEVIVELYPANNRSCIEFKLPYGPVDIDNGLSSISVSKRDGPNSDDYNEMVLDTDYRLVGGQSMIFIPNLPGVYELVYNARFSEIPKNLIGAIKSEIAFRYERRGDQIDDSSKTLCASAINKAQPYKVFAWL